MEQLALTSAYAPFLNISDVPLLNIIPVSATSGTTTTTCATNSVLQSDVPLLNIFPVSGTSAQPLVPLTQFCQLVAQVAQLALTRGYAPLLNI